MSKVGELVRDVRGKEGSDCFGKSSKVGFSCFHIAMLNGNREANERTIGPTAARAIEKHPQDFFMISGDDMAARVIPEIDQSAIVALGDHETFRFTSGTGN